MLWVLNWLVFDVRLKVIFPINILFIAGIFNLLFLVSVKSRFFNPVVPGDQLQITVTPLKMLSNMGIFKAEAMVGDKKIAEGEIAFGTQEAKKGL